MTSTLQAQPALHRRHHRHHSGILTHRSFTIWHRSATGIYDAKARWRLNSQSRCDVLDIISFRNRDAVSIGVEIKAGRD